ncbi:hypothetical protein [Mycobacteroides sp. LB1]|nr:hypothetical protein [Mycobacteroides sp. LB1]
MGSAPTVAMVEKPLPGVVVSFTTTAAPTTTAPAATTANDLRSIDGV